MQWANSCLIYEFMVQDLCRLTSMCLRSIHRAGCFQCSHYSHKITDQTCSPKRRAYAGLWCRLCHWRSPHHPLKLEQQKFAPRLHHYRWRWTSLARRISVDITNCNLVTKPLECVPVGSSRHLEIRRARDLGIGAREAVLCSSFDSYGLERDRAGSCSA